MEIKRKFLSPAGQKLEIGWGDITSENVDAIVNAANSHLNHGAGVARAILDRGGETLTEESRRWVETHGPVAHDSPAHTSGGDLPCKFVIHTVGPVWGEGEEERKLTTAIRSSLELAEKLGVESIAFPAISTGIFGFPIRRAAEIFMKEFNEYLSTQRLGLVNSIKMVLYDENTLLEFLDAFDKIFDEEAGK
jgi:O-acetyl-ADP-ribose deacetylase (regulator of RNase III)